MLGVRASLYSYQGCPYDSDRTFSTLDSDANPELRRKEAVVVNCYPTRNSDFVRPSPYTQSDEHVNVRLGPSRWSPCRFDYRPMHGIKSTFLNLVANVASDNSGKIAREALDKLIALLRILFFIAIIVYPFGR